MFSLLFLKESWCSEDDNYTTEPEPLTATITRTANVEQPTISKFKIDEQPFRVEGGTPENRQEVQKSLREIFETPKGAEILAELKSRRFLWFFPQEFTVRLLDLRDPSQYQDPDSAQGVSETPSFAYGFSSVITIDPNWLRERSFHTANGAVPFTIRRALAHELGHAAFGTTDEDMLNIIENENPIMNALGQPSRTAYYE